VTSVAVVAVVSAWAVLALGEATGIAAALHHHALIEAGPPLPVAAAAFLIGWSVMVVAMMLPGVLPDLRRAVHAADAGRGTRAPTATFLGGYLGAFLAVWALFGLAAFGGDVLVHRAVDSLPWLSDRAWLIEATVLALAGAWQFSPMKRTSLHRHRHPPMAGGSADVVAPGPRSLGWQHAVLCLEASWALMLVAFGDGFASLVPMAALTMLMTYEAAGEHGARIASLAGVALLVAAVATVAG